MSVEATTFHSYSPAERRADAAVHVLGVAFAILGGTWLIAATARAGDVGTTASVVVYCLGLAGMIGASAGFNLAPAGRVKALLRRVDHAMILVMIAGSYTPFAANLMPAGLGVPLCIAVWGLAAVGAVLAMGWPRWLQRWGVVLYLGAGWLILPLYEPISAALPPAVMTLLIAGGAVYSAGIVVHLSRWLPFHNALWHALVLAAAITHFVAMAIAFAG
ncbi:MAG: hemolysin III family protein [Alphaproteobacteria bacterium]|nr:hemolysin III family protein [Alphaproteobacteria bacterium]